MESWEKRYLTLHPEDKELIEKNFHLPDMELYLGDDALVPAQRIYDDILKSVPREKIPLPFPGLNVLMGGGFLPNDFVIISGATKMGKTLFMAQIANFWPDKTLFLALEDTVQEQLRREYEKYNIVTNPPYFSFTKRPKNGFTLDWLKLKIIEGMQKFNINKVIIDNLDWIEGGEDYKKNKEILRTLKQWCDDFNILIVLVVHIKGDSAYAFGTKRPDIQSIKGGSHIYQMGTKVILLWRVLTVQDDKKIEAGYTKVILALDRHSGALEQDTHVKYNQGKFEEISNDEYLQLKGTYVAKKKKVEEMKW